MAASDVLSVLAGFRVNPAVAVANSWLGTGHAVRLGPTVFLVEQRDGDRWREVARADTREAAWREVTRLAAVVAAVTGGDPN